jgi:hypothetical protein
MKTEYRNLEEAGYAPVHAARGLSSAAGIEQSLSVA